VSYIIEKNPGEATGEVYETITEALRAPAPPGACVFWEAFSEIAVARERGDGRWELTTLGLKLECERFASGKWQMELPTEAGTYPVAERQGHLAGLRYLVSLKGKIFDPGNVKQVEEGSEWKGWWWSEAHPELPNAPDGTKESKA